MILIEAKYIKYGIIQSFLNQSFIIIQNYINYIFIKIILHNILYISCIIIMNSFIYL